DDKRQKHLRSPHVVPIPFGILFDQEIFLAARTADETRSVHNQRQQPEYTLTDGRAQHGKEKSTIHRMTHEGIRASRDQVALLLTRYGRGPPQTETGTRPDRETDTHSTQHEP